MSYLVIVELYIFMDSDTCNDFVVIIYSMGTETDVYMVIC